MKDCIKSIKEVKFLGIPIIHEEVQHVRYFTEIERDIDILMADVLEEEAKYKTDN